MGSVQILYHLTERACGASVGVGVLTGSPDGSSMFLRVQL